MNLIEIAHLRGVCGRLGVNRVNYTANTLVCRLDAHADIDPAKLYSALEQTDNRLLLSASKEPAILFRDAKMNAEQLLRAAVPVLERVEAVMEEKE